VGKNKFANEHDHPEGTDQNCRDETDPQVSRSFTFSIRANTCYKSANRQDERTDPNAKPNPSSEVGDRTVLIYRICLIEKLRAANPVKELPPEV
jgi:hypothetical protein